MSPSSPIRTAIWKIKGQHHLLYFPTVFPSLTDTFSFALPLSPCPFLPSPEFKSHFVSSSHLFFIRTLIFSLMNNEVHHALRWPFLCLCIFRLGRRKIFDKALFESRLHVELFLRSTVGKTQMERCPGALPQTPPHLCKEIS